MYSLSYYKVYSKCTLKPGSQSDARPCIAFTRETHKFIISKVGDFLTTGCKNAMQRNARIGSKSILALCYVSISDDTMQRIV